MTIILYSTNCPRCIVLEKKLEQKKIDFKLVNDVEIMQKEGFTQAPMLEVDGKIMGFTEAVNWINNNNCKEVK